MKQRHRPVEAGGQCTRSHVPQEGSGAASGQRRPRNCCGETRAELSKKWSRHCGLGLGPSDGNTLFERPHCWQRLRPSDAGVAQTFDGASGHTHGLRGFAAVVKGAPSDVPLRRKCCDGSCQVKHAHGPHGGRDHQGPVLHKPGATMQCSILVGEKPVGRGGGGSFRPVKLCVPLRSLSLFSSSVPCVCSLSLSLALALAPPPPLPFSPPPPFPLEDRGAGTRGGRGDHTGAAGWYFRCDALGCVVADMYAHVRICVNMYTRIRPVCTH